MLILKISGDSALILLPCFIAHPLQMLIDSFLIQPLKSSPHFPLCVPWFCAKCRAAEETDRTEDYEAGKDNIDDVVANPGAAGINMDTMNNDKSTV